MRPQRLFRICFATLGLLLGTAARGELVFESTELVLKPRPGERKLTGEFHFTNRGEAPVTLTEVSSGCSCTVPEAAEGAVAPGALGVVPVTYSPGSRQGRQIQPVTVVTSDGKTYELRVVADLPVRVTIAPRLLVFSGPAPEPRGITLTYSADTPVTLLEVISRPPAFVVEGTPALEGDELRIRFRYAGEAADDVRATARVRVRDAAGVEHTDVLYLRHAP